MRFKRALILFLGLMLLLTGCGPKETPADNVPKETDTVTEAPTEAAEAPTEVPAPVSEPIYNSSRSAGELPEVDVRFLYLTVKEGDSDDTNHTWAEINTYSAQDYADMGVNRYKMMGVLREGTADGVSEDGGMVCTVSFRGQASSRAPQKSYKIKLADDEWMDQKVLNLNKHYPDSTRFLNKLAYDIIDEVPQLIGLKTQFVRLYVKDLSDGADPDTAEYVDYGLFTHVEQLNSRAMKRLGMDDDCSLYKVNGFEFWEYDDVRLTTDPEYDKTKFEVRLENKGTTDNEKLIALMDAVNKGEVSDQELLDRYIEKENFAYWMAFQILLDNVDTNCRNFYLYSPEDSERWYIISWDNDGAFARVRNDISGGEFVPWRLGVHDYWGNCLFRNLLRTKDFRDALVEAANDLVQNYMTPAHIRELLELYEQKAGYILTEGADAVYFHPDFHEQIISRIPDEIQNGYDRLIDSLNRPTPYFIGGPTYDPETSEVYVPWNESYDFDGQKLTYIVEVSNDPAFGEVLLTVETEDTRTAFTHAWGDGTFYVRVTAKNEDGCTMSALSSVWVEGFGTVYGSQVYTVGE